MSASDNTVRDTLLTTPIVGEWTLTKILSNEAPSLVKLWEDGVKEKVEYGGGIYITAVFITIGVPTFYPARQPPTPLPVIRPIQEVFAFTLLIMKSNVSTTTLGDFIQRFIYF
ncbi:hypothetical protein M407DRAFT_32110 [Tulasnella calospora MUT 4182]|uniref:Uncharacterized protein n=1 Tax=Tulasnella calospora MUT 4182 TaxID=1051891 RepID=A0A0C3L9R6_9AGAM|nr:hypothetical protein M407DRAFT_32110 [Tulasnella calospora MUT 4182]